MAERLMPDLITMDVQMPVMDGLEATKQIMVRSPRPIIIVSSTARTDEVELSLDATRAGALMVLPKPEGPASPGFAEDRRQLISMVRAMSQVKVVRHHATVVAGHRGAPSLRPTCSAQPFSAAITRGAPIRAVAIGASTGGPAAIRTILADLPGNFPVPILVVQHIARGFAAGLTRWLASDTALHVKLAEIGERAKPGTVYIAPDDRHLGCHLDAAGEIRLALDIAAPISAFRPSASYLFQSAADCLGAGVLAVILTGMGDDGITGLRVVKARGGCVLAQDEASSVIYGMPREAQRAGVVDAVIGVDAIARRLVELTT
jgi:two-component system chemotaxis response regulator CheB